MERADREYVIRQSRGLITIDAAEFERMRLFDAPPWEGEPEDRKRCVCIHESMATSLGLRDGPSNQCENLTRYPGGRCADCRISLRTVDGGALMERGA